MKNKQKKIIAREFLIFVGTFISVIVVGFLLKSLSEYSNSKVEKLEISKFRISATMTDLYKFAKEGEFNSKEDFVNYVEKNTIKDCYSKIMDGVFLSLSEFEKFVPEYAIDSGTEVSKKVLLIEEEIQGIEKSFYYKLNNDFLFIMALVFFFNNIPFEIYLLRSKMEFKNIERG
jgi:hypothetical protein